MIIAADCGNTFTKFFILDNSYELISKYKYDSSNISRNYEKLIQKYSPQILLISSVSREIEEILIHLSHSLDINIYHVRNSKNILQYKYNPPESLGEDRVLVSEGAVFLYPNSDIIIADAGTALTIDVITNGITFEGGIIIPGMQTAADCLTQGTSLLPQITIKNTDSLIGNDTVSCINNGIVNSWRYLTAEYAEQIDKKYKKNFIKVITGGNGQFLAIDNDWTYIEDLSYIGFKAILTRLFADN